MYSPVYIYNVLMVLESSALLSKLRKYSATLIVWLLYCNVQYCTVQSNLSMNFAAKTNHLMICTDRWMFTCYIFMIMYTICTGNVVVTKIWHFQIILNNYDSQVFQLFMSAILLYYKILYCVSWRMGIMPAPW